MVEAILVFGSIGFIYFGIGIVDAFDRDYGEIPYDALLTGLTGLFLLFAAMAGLGDSSKFWIILWLVLAVLFYYLSFRSTIETIKRIQPSQRDIVYVLIGQLILPLGTALFLLLILALLFGGGHGKRRKR